MKKPPSIPIDINYMHLDIHTNFYGWKDPIENALRKIDAEIYAVDGKTDETIQIGSIGAYMLDKDALDEANCSVYAALDLESATTPFMVLLDEDDISDTIRESFDQSIDTENILIMDRLEISPQYQGQNAGIVAMRLFMVAHQKQVNLFALKAFPLQYEVMSRHIDKIQKYGHAVDDKRFKDDAEKLQKLYARLGFRPIEDGKAPADLMVASAAVDLPAMEALLKPASKKRKPR